MCNKIAAYFLFITFSSWAYGGDCDRLQKKISSNFQGSSTRLLVFNDTVSYFTSNGNYFYHCQDKSLFENFKNKASEKNLETITINHNIEEDFPLVCYNCTPVSLTGSITSGSKLVNCKPYECSFKNIHERTLAIYFGAKQPISVPSTPASTIRIPTEASPQ